MSRSQLVSHCLAQSCANSDQSLVRLFIGYFHEAVEKASESSSLQNHSGKQLAKTHNVRNSQVNQRVRKPNAEKGDGPLSILRLFSNELSYVGSREIRYQTLRQVLKLCACET